MPPPKPKVAQKKPASAPRSAPTPAPARSRSENSSNGSSSNGSQRGRDRTPRHPQPQASVLFSATKDARGKTDITHVAPRPVEGDSADNRAHSPRRKTRGELQRIVDQHQDGDATEVAHAGEELQVRQAIDNEVGQRTWADRMRGKKLISSTAVDVHRAMASHLDEATARRGSASSSAATSVVMGVSHDPGTNVVGYGRSGAGVHVAAQHDSGVVFSGRLQLSQARRTETIGEHTRHDETAVADGDNDQLAVCAAVRAQLAVGHQPAETQHLKRRDVPAPHGVLESAQDKPKGGWGRSAALVRTAKTIETARGETTAYVQSCNTCMGEPRPPVRQPPRKAPAKGPAGKQQSSGRAPRREAPRKAAPKKPPQG